MRELEFQAADWEETSLGDICTFRGGNGFNEKYQGNSAGEIPFIKVSDLTLSGNGKYITFSQNWISFETLKKLKGTLHPKNSVVFAKVGAALKLNRRRILTRPTAIDNNMMVAIADSNRIDSNFLYYFMNIQDLSRFSQESAVPSVNQGHLASIKIGLPPLPEQHKIAEILRTWDEAIEKLEALKVANENRYKAFARQLFDPCHPTFYGRSNTWLEFELGDVFRERSQSGRDDDRLLSITMNSGVIDRDDVGRKDTSTEDKSKYKLILPGDIGYNTMRMWQGVSGLSSLRGIISPAYTVVTPVPNRILGSYASHLFKSRRMVFDFERYSQGLTSDTWNLKFPAFSKIKVYLPPIEDQKKQAELLDALAVEGALIQTQLKALTHQKRGLMQKLLTGEWRLSC